MSELNIIILFISFREIKAGLQLRDGGGLPCRFFKIEKVPWFWEKKGPDSVHHWVKPSIQNVVLRVSTKKSSNVFPCFFLVFLTKCLSKCSNFTKLLLPWKISGFTPVMLVTFWINIITYYFYLYKNLLRLPNIHNFTHLFKNKKHDTLTYTTDVINKYKVMYENFWHLSIKLLLPVRAKNCHNTKWLIFQANRYKRNFGEKSLIETPIVICWKWQVFCFMPSFSRFNIF